MLAPHMHTPYTGYYTVSVAKLQQSYETRRTGFSDDVPGGPKTDTPSAPHIFIKNLDRALIEPGMKTFEDLSGTA